MIVVENSNARIFRGNNAPDKPPAVGAAAVDADGAWLQEDVAGLFSKYGLEAMRKTVSDSWTAGV